MAAMSCHLSPRCVCFWLTRLSVCLSASLALSFSFAASAWALWLGMVSYGLFVGPVSGLIFDLNNRITDYSEFGTALPALGVNIGDSLLIFLTAAVWDAGGGPMSFLWCLLVYVGVCPLLTQLTLYMENDAEEEKEEDDPSDQEKTKR